MRTAQLIINGVTVPHEENKGGGLYFEADYNSGKTNEIGSMKFSIYNLSQEIKPDTTIHYDFGRQSDFGRFGTFVVKVRNVEKKGADTVQVLLCSERAVESSNVVSVSIKGQVKSSQAIREICKNAGLEAVQVDLKNDKVYSNSYSCYGKALDELKKISENTNTKFKIEGREVRFYTDTIKKNEIVQLDFTSGLLKNPLTAERLTLDKKNDILAELGEIEALYLTDSQLKAERTKEFDYTVVCLSIHYIKKGSLVQISGTKTFNGLARVVEMSMRNSKEWTMELKVKVM